MRRYRLPIIVLFGALIVLIAISVIVLLTIQGKPLIPSPDTHLSYWGLIFTRTSSLAKLAWCSWAIYITLGLLLISIVDFVRHHKLTKIGIVSFVLAISIALCSSAYTVNVFSNEGTYVDHIHSINFKGKVYQLAYERSVVDVGLNGRYVVYSCSPPGLWCEKLTSTPISEPLSTNLYQFGSFVIEQDKLYAKVGEEMVLVAT
jgi:hypothetical protein